MGDTATTGAAHVAIASRREGTARIGSMLRNGLDGQITTARRRGSRSAASTSGCARAVSAPLYATSRTARAQRPRTKLPSIASHHTAVHGRAHTIFADMREARREIESRTEDWGERR